MTWDYYVWNPPSLSCTFPKQALNRQGYLDRHLALRQGLPYRTCLTRSLFCSVDLACRFSCVSILASGHSSKSFPCIVSGLSIYCCHFSEVLWLVPAAPGPGCICKATHGPATLGTFKKTCHQLQSSCAFELRLDASRLGRWWLGRESRSEECRTVASCRV